MISTQCSADTKHQGAVIELISGGTDRLAERAQDALARNDMTSQQLGAATELVLPALEDNTLRALLSESQRYTSLIPTTTPTNTSLHATGS